MHENRFSTLPSTPQIVKSNPLGYHLLFLDALFWEICAAYAQRVAVRFPFTNSSNHSLRCGRLLEDGI